MEPNTNGKDCQSLTNDGTHHYIVSARSSTHCIITSQNTNETSRGSCGGGSGGSQGGAKRKRGRPRKYNFDNITLQVPSQPPILASPISVCSVKRKRGRPRGSTKQPILDSLGCIAAETTGGNFTPHVISVSPGEDVVEKILAFSHSGPQAVSVLSASGSVSSVVIRQPTSSGGFLKYEGQFQILTLTGSYTVRETGVFGHKSGMLSVSLAKTDGVVFGGAVAGSVIAGGPIQLVLASFKQYINEDDQKMRPSSESFNSASTVGNSDIVRLQATMALAPTDTDEGSVKPKPTHLESQPYGGSANMTATSSQNMNLPSLYSIDHEISQASQSMIGPTSPEINNSEPRI